MSDYMAQKADDQIEAGINERDELLAEITALKEKIRGLECDFQLDANRAVEFKEKLALAVEKLTSFVGQRERWTDEHGFIQYTETRQSMEARETLAKLGEKMEGKE